jgi:hypothetical protein
VGVALEEAGSLVGVVGDGDDVASLAVDDDEGVLSAEANTEAEALSVGVRWGPVGSRTGGAGGSAAGAAGLVSTSSHAGTSVGVSGSAGQSVVPIWATGMPRS